MKEKVLKFVCLLCLFVPRVSVAQIFTHSSSHRSAQMPSVSMRSTSSMRTGTSAMAMRTGSSYSYSGSRSKNVATTSVYKPVANVQGFYTAASNVYGGVTAAQMQFSARKSGSRRAKMDDDPPSQPEDGCSECNWVENKEAPGGWSCSQCGWSIVEGCECAERGYCWCPVGDGMDVWVMMFALAMTYGIFKVRKGKKELPEC